MCDDENGLNRRVEDESKTEKASKKGEQTAMGFYCVLLCRAYRNTCRNVCL